jgi:hypothetical protein
MYPLPRQSLVIVHETGIQEKMGSRRTISNGTAGDEVRGG